MSALLITEPWQELLAPYRGIAVRECAGCHHDFYWWEHHDFSACSALAAYREEAAILDRQKGRLQ